MPTTTQRKRQEKAKIKAATKKEKTAVKVEKVIKVLNPDGTLQRIIKP